jgi:hypothetical protein
MHAGLFIVFLSITSPVRITRVIEFVINAGKLREEPGEED